MPQPLETDLDATDWLATATGDVRTSSTLGRRVNMYGNPGFAGFGGGPDAVNMYGYDANDVHSVAMRSRAARGELPEDIPGFRNPNVSYSGFNGRQDPAPGRGGLPRETPRPWGGVGEAGKGIPPGNLPNARQVEVWTTKGYSSGDFEGGGGDGGGGGGGAGGGGGGLGGRGNFVGGFKDPRVLSSRPLPELPPRRPDVMGQYFDGERPHLPPGGGRSEGRVSGGRQMTGNGGMVTAGRARGPPDVPRGHGRDFGHPGDVRHHALHVDGLPEPYNTNPAYRNNNSGGSSSSSGNLASIKKRPSSVSSSSQDDFEYFTPLGIYSSRPRVIAASSTDRLKEESEEEEEDRGEEQEVEDKGWRKRLREVPVFRSGPSGLQSVVAAGGKCRDCMTRVPYATLIATVMCCVGVGVFCGTMYRGTNLTLRMFDEVFKFRVKWVEPVQLTFMIVGAGMGGLGLMILFVGCLSTGDTRTRVYKTWRGRVGGRISCAIFMGITYILSLAWLLMLCALIIVTLLYTLAWLQCQHIPENECIDYNQFSFLFPSSTLEEDMRVCTGEKKQFCKDFVNNAEVMFILASVSAFLVILSLIHYLMCLAANYAHIKDQEKFMDLQEIQFLQESEMSTLPKDRF